MAIIRITFLSWLGISPILSLKRMRHLRQKEENSSFPFPCHVLWILRVLSSINLLETHENMKKFLEEDITRIAERLGSLANRFDGKTVLITGAAGFVGGYMLGLFQYLNKNILEHPMKVIAIVTPSGEYTALMPSGSRNSSRRTSPGCRGGSFRVMSSSPGPSRALSSRSPETTAIVHGSGRRTQ